MFSEDSPSYYFEWTRGFLLFSQRHPSRKGSMTTEWIREPFSKPWGMTFAKQVILVCVCALNISVVSHCTHTQISLYMYII